MEALTRVAGSAVLGVELVVFQAQSKDRLLACALTPRSPATASGGPCSPVIETLESSRMVSHQSFVQQILRRGCGRLAVWPLAVVLPSVLVCLGDMLLVSQLQRFSRRLARTWFYAFCTTCSASLACLLVQWLACFWPLGFPLLWTSCVGAFFSILTLVLWLLLVSPLVFGCFPGSW